MTDNEIIKALECCGSETTIMTCGDCPLLDVGKPDCHFSNAKKALDLINRQKARIEELEKGELSKAMTFNSDTIKRCSAEAIREFAERLKMAFYYEFEELIPSIMADKIDEIVKEMTEGENG